MSVFGFAWVDPGEDTFISGTHFRQDEDIFSLLIQGQEGSAATASVVIENPRIGLLNAGRKIWAWISWKDDAEVIHPLMFARLVGIPENVFAELVTLAFVSRPLDIAAQRRTLAATMAVLPWYDPVFINEDLRLSSDGSIGDPDTVLEAYSKRWCISRGEDGGPLTVSASDICVGEDGTEAFTGDEVPYNSLSLTISGAPLNSISVKAGVSWKFTGQGPTINLGSWSFPTYTGSSLISSWPKAGASLGGGWAVAASSCVDAFRAEYANTHSTNYQWQNKAKQHTEGDSMSLSINRTDVLVNGPYYSAKLSEQGNPGVVWAPGFDTPTTVWSTRTTGPLDELGNPVEPDDLGDVINVPAHLAATWMVVPQSLINASLSITIDSSQARSEKINFTMVPDIQALLTLPGDYDTGQGATPSDEEILDLSGADVSVAIDGVAPLPDTKASTYWTSERGLQSAEYTLLRARARLLAAQRVVQASWTVPFARAIDLTCRKSASLTDSRIPGGQLSGKITAYTISATGGSRDQGGQLTGSVTVMCSIGRGGSVDAVAGYNNDWVEDDWVEDDYINVGGSTIVASGTTDVAYNPDQLIEIPTSGLSSFGLNLSAGDVILKNETHGSIQTQLGIISTFARAAFNSGKLTNEQQSAWAQACQSAMQEALKDNSVWLELWLKPLSETALENGLPLDVEPLKVPQTIDLEAASSG